MSIHLIRHPLVLASCLLLSTGLAAEPVRDCVLEGTVKKQSDDADKVYVAFHSYRAAEQGAPCRIRRSEKLHFKQPAGTGIENVPPGSRVEYRYTEDEDRSQKWELRKVSERSSS